MRFKCQSKNLIIYPQTAQIWPGLLWTCNLLLKFEKKYYNPIVFEILFTQFRNEVNFIKTEKLYGQMFYKLLSCMMITLFLLFIIIPLLISEKIII